MAFPMLPLLLLGGGGLAFALASGKKTLSPAAPAPALPPATTTPAATAPAAAAAAATVPALADIVTRTPGVWAAPAATAAPATVWTPPAPAATSKPATPAAPVLDTTMQTAVANALRTLGIDPATGKSTGATVTPAGIESVTALAALLESQGHTDLGKVLRAYAGQAANTVTVTAPAPVSAAVPADVATQIARALSLEGDPQRIRDLVDQVSASPYASDPNVRAALKALDARAQALQVAIDKAHTETELARVLATPPSASLPEPKPLVVPTTYTVQAGDNPSLVAKKFTGNPNRWPELAAANPNKTTGKKGKEFSQFFAGWTLNLPASWSSTPVTPAPTVPAASTPISTAVVPTTTTSSAVPATYTVQTGDNPSLVAKKFTGDANRWRELAAANPSKTTGKKGKEFSQFFTGWVLTIPESWRV